jgi:hypothetical protein
MNGPRRPILGYHARKTLSQRLWPLLLPAALVAAPFLLVAGQKVTRVMRHSGRPAGTIIHGVDADTGAPVPIYIGSGNSSVELSVAPTEDPSAIRVEWTDVDRVRISVGSAGYLQTTATFGGQPATTTTVQLRKPR